MTTNYHDAKSEMFALLNAAWQANTVAIVGYVPAIYWQMKEEPATPDPSKYWARCSRQTVLEQQTTLSTCEGANGQRRFTTFGLLFVQIFCPKAAENVGTIAEKLAQVAKDAYRKQQTTSGIVFRNVRINELPPENQYYRLNVVAEFEYDELF